jgi:hypothetical protein
LSGVAAGIVVYAGIARVFRFDELNRALRLAGRLVGRPG